MRLRKAGIKDFFWIYKNYKKDFPENEKKPVYMILRNAYQRRISDILILEDQGDRVAYAMSLKGGRDNCVLIDYLAVAGTCRSRGYGGTFIEALKRFYHDKAGIIVEIETPGKGADNQQNQQRERRQAFYFAHGFIKQPVTLDLFGVEMLMLYLPIQTSHFDDFKQVADRLYDHVFDMPVLRAKAKVFRDER